MDRFRVLALEKALGLDLAPWQRELVKKELVRKCRILAVGFEKRGNTNGAEPYRELIRRHGSLRRKRCSEVRQTGSGRLKTSS
jgi:hypothetical protein